MNTALGRKLGRPASAAVSGALTVILSLTGAGTAQAGHAHAAAQKRPVIDKSGTESCDPLTKFKRKNFEDSAEIDNKLYPLQPGTQFTLQGVANTGGGLRPHTVILTVTDFVKEIDGVQTRVLWDQDIEDGQVLESELAFQAQDESGNVWVLGEFPVEFEYGQPVAPDTWISGVDDARGGVLVPGRPKKGEPFLEGESLDIDFLDCGQVFKTHKDDVCAAGKCYDDVLVISESSPLDPEGGIQRKFYAPGVGNVKITAVNDPEGETLDLVEKEKLGANERIKADLAALKLEKLAYKISEVYEHTTPMKLQPCSNEKANSSACLRSVRALKQALQR